MTRSCFACDTGGFFSGASAGRMLDHVPLFRHGQLVDGFMSKSGTPTDSEVFCEHGL